MPNQQPMEDELCCLPVFGSPSTGAYRPLTNINIDTTGGRIWERCAWTIGTPELYAHPGYATAPARSKNRDALNAEIEAHRDEVDQALGTRVQQGRRALYIDQKFEDAPSRSISASPRSAERGGPPLSVWSANP
ncbi:hypothetical protein [Bradyrhizobium sp. 23AC]